MKGSEGRVDHLPKLAELHDNTIVIPPAVTLEPLSPQQETGALKARWTNLGNKLLLITGY